MNLKKLYDESQRNTVESTITRIVEFTTGEILKGRKLPYYLSGIQLSGVSWTYLKDMLKQHQGIVISHYPEGVIIQDLVEVDEN